MSRAPALCVLVLVACGDSGGFPLTSFDTDFDTTTTTSTSTTADTTFGTTFGTTFPPPVTSASLPTTVDEPTTTATDDTATSTTTDTTDTTGAPLACPPGFFCEDFEDDLAGQVPGAPWQPDIGDASAVVDTSKSASGNNSVHITTGNSYGGRALLNLDTPDVFPATHLYGRMRVWLTQASPDGVHWTMISADGTAQAPGVWNDQPFAATIRYGGQHEQRLMANYDTPGFYSNEGPGSDCWHHSEQKIPEQTWTCMEWEFDSDTRTMRFWLDGAEVPDLTVGAEGQGCVHHDAMDQWYYPSLDRMSFGWVDYQDGGSRDLWIDDITVGPSRVGCNPP